MYNKKELYDKIHAVLASDPEVIDCLNSGHISERVRGLLEGVGPAVVELLPSTVALAYLHVIDAIVFPHKCTEALASAVQAFRLAAWEESR